MHYIKSLPLKTHAILALTLMVICNIFLFTYLNQLKTETCTNNNAVIVNIPTVDCRVASKSCPNLKCIKNDENQQQYSKHYLPSNLPNRLVYDDPYPDYLLKYCKEQKYLYDVNLHRTIITPPLDEFYFNEATKGTWEKNTFATFHHFVGPETTYIDFGTWNGITLLFGAAHAKRAYGLECDQVAYRKAKNNLLCNPEINLKTRLIETCVYTSHSIGLMNMRGGSDSSVEFLVGDNISMVEMRTLEMVFDDYNIKGHVFIKMDAEGAECVLIPYLYDFVNERYPKPTIFVSMHNGPRTGNKTCDWEKFLSVIQLYDNAGVWGEFWKSTDEWTIEDILKCKKKTWDIIMTNVPLEDLNRIDRNQ